MAQYHEQRSDLQALVAGQVIPAVRDNLFDVCYPMDDRAARRVLVASENAKLKAAGYRTRITRYHRAILVLAVA